MVMETSNHYPMAVTFSTSTPKGQVFRFENFWLQQPGFQDLLQKEWTNNQHHGDCTKTITSKFKALRKALKAWHSNLSSLKANIANVKLVSEFLETIEDFRDLNLEEWNFREIFRTKQFHNLGTTKNILETKGLPKMG